MRPVHSSSDIFGPGSLHDLSDDATSELTAVNDSGDDIMVSEPATTIVSTPAKEKPTTIISPTKAKGVYCHQCRKLCSPHSFLRCTNVKSVSKAGGPSKVCNIAFCKTDLLSKYHTNIDNIRSRTDDSTSDDSYTWTCPHCTGICDSSNCRKSRGLEPLGNASKVKPNHTLATNELNQNSSALYPISDSDLSSLDPLDAVEIPVLLAPPRKTVKPKKASAAARPKVPTDGEMRKVDQENRAVIPVAEAKTTKKAYRSNPVNKRKKGDADVEARSGKKSKNATPQKNKQGKGDSKATPKKRLPNPKPVEKVEKPVQPPPFEKVDTRLRRFDAEQRIMLREFVFRFREVLSIPERSIWPLDDFDRSFSDASVRLYAGAILDLIIPDLPSDSDEDRDRLDTVQNFREQLRYYADLARFASVMVTLRDLIPLPEANLEPEKSETALELGDYRMIDVPTRRSGTSRIPSPSEVVNLLLCLAERALSTPDIRRDLDRFGPENDIRKAQLRYLKTEDDKWEAKKKKLSEARLTSKSSAEGKIAREKFAAEQREHDMRLGMISTNITARLARRSLRHAPLGTDLDGRVYYWLSPRTVDESSRPPIGWASGLLVWGQGVSPGSDDDLPVTVERWSHFGKSISVKQLIKWLEWRTRTRPQAEPVSTPSKTKRMTMEVVIPTSSRRKAKVYPKSPQSDSSSTLSSLSSLPDTGLRASASKDIGAYINKADSNMTELIEELKQVHTWLEVLEWKGMGEVA